MTDGRLARPEGCLAKYSRVQRLPAHVLAVQDQLIAGSVDPPVRLSSCKSGVFQGCVALCVSVGSAPQCRVFDYIRPDTMADVADYRSCAECLTGASRLRYPTEPC